MDCSNHTVYPIIIVGAGIGGLATAVALQKNGFFVQIYERDVDFNARRQGYSLTIQRNGYGALEKLGIAEHVRTLGNGSMIEGTTTYTSLGEIILSKLKQRNSNHRFTNFAVPRQSLRACLIDALAADTIQWNKAISRYEPLRNDIHHVRIIFSDNTSIVARALIGCDGVHSLIRKQMIGDKENYLGIWAINGISLHHKHPSLQNHTVQMIDGRSRVFVKPFSIDMCMWQLTFKVEQNDEMYSQLQNANMEDLLNRAKTIVKAWHDPIPKLINDTLSDDIRAGPIFDRTPLEKISKDIACVTILGDAAHPMSPFKGQGANQALIDGILLTDQLLRHKEEMYGIEHAFQKFESEMLIRCKRYILQSRFAVKFLHTEHALKRENMLEFVNGKFIFE